MVVLVCVCRNRHSFNEKMFVNKLITSTINHTIDEKPILAVFRFPNELLRMIFFALRIFGIVGGRVD